MSTSGFYEERWRLIESLKKDIAEVTEAGLEAGKHLSEIRDTICMIIGDTMLKNSSLVTMGGKNMGDDLMCGIRMDDFVWRIVAEVQREHEENIEAASRQLAGIEDEEDRRSILGNTSTKDACEGQEDEDDLLARRLRRSGRYGKGRRDFTFMVKHADGDFW